MCVQFSQRFKIKEIKNKNVKT